MSQRLRRKILRRIEAGGPITFAEYMDLALYDPEDGFFSSSPVGRAAHFVTSPHVSAVFGILVARALFDAWQALGSPATFTVVEAGAGEGALARQVLRSATGAFAEALHYVAVEQSARARTALARAGIEARAGIDEAVGGPFTGVIIANELLDNIPFHRIAGDRELLVGAEGDRLVYVEAAPSREVLEAMSSMPEQDEHRPASPAARAYVRDALSHLARGSMILFDYGFTAGEPVEPIRGYREQRLVDDVLAEPGSCDITGPVDFDAIAAEARAAGFDVHGPISQREALLALGYRDVVEQLRAQQQVAQDAGESRRALELFEARNEAAMIVDPDGLGALKVVAFTTPGVPAPSAFGG